MASERWQPAVGASNPPQIGLGSGESRQRLNDVSDAQGVGVHT